MPFLSNLQCTNKSVFHTPTYKTTVYALEPKELEPEACRENQIHKSNRINNHVQQMFVFL